MKSIKEEILCAGSGGQGIILMGRLLAYAAMKSGYDVSWIPSYGAEVRGGTAYSMVRIQKGIIANPVVSNPNSCIIMNKPSLLRFIGNVQPKGLVLIDSTDIIGIPERKDLDIRKIPFTKIAADLGDVRSANMIAAAAYNKIKKLFSLENLIESLPFIFPNKTDLIGFNENALRKGSEIEV